MCDPMWMIVVFGNCWSLKLFPINKLSFILISLCRDSKNLTKGWVRKIYNVRLWKGIPMPALPTINQIFRIPLPKVQSFDAPSINRRTCQCFDIYWRIYRLQLLEHRRHHSNWTRCPPTPRCRTPTERRFLPARNTTSIWSGREIGNRCKEDRLNLNLPWTLWCFFDGAKNSRIGAVFLILRFYVKE